MLEIAVIAPKAVDNIEDSTTIGMQANVVARDVILYNPKQIINGQ